VGWNVLNAGRKMRKTCSEAREKGERDMWIGTKKKVSQVVEDGWERKGALY